MTARRLLLILAALVVVAVVAAPGARAGTCSVTDLPGSGTLTSSSFNARWRQIETCINGNIGNANVSASEQLAVGKLANQNAIYSQPFTLTTNDSGAGSVVATGTDLRMWRIPVTSTVIGMSLKLDACTGCSVTVTLQKDSTTIKTFAGIATTTTQTDFTLSNSVTNAQDLNIDVSGTMTGVKRIDVVVYEKAQHQT